MPKGSLWFAKEGRARRKAGANEDERQPRQETAGGKRPYLDQRVLILDEATSVLTRSEADEVLGLLKRMAIGKHGAAASHRWPRRLAGAA
jgi:hypothetical protein